MTSAIALFGAFENHNVRWNGDIDDPWWVAADVCKVLGLTNVSMAVNGNPKTGDLGLEVDEKDNIVIPDVIGRNRKTIIVNEFGLHRLIFKSRTEKAKKLQRWMFHEVLPSIRKYGCYPPPALEEDEDEEWTWEAAIFAFLLRFALEFGESLELNDMRVIAALGFGWLREEDISNAAIAVSLKLDEVEVFRRVDRLREWGVIDCDRLLLLPPDLIPHTSE